MQAARTADGAPRVQPSVLTTGPWNRPASIMGLVGSSALILLALLAPQGPTMTWQAAHPAALAAAAAAVLIQLGRRRWPVVALCLLLGLSIAAVPLGAYSPALTVSVAVAIYSCAIGLKRRTALILAFGSSALVFVLLIAAGNEFPANIMAVILGGAVGDAVKSHRTAMAEALSRAEHAEATREAEALQRVAEDRLSIARDLHDVVAHQIAVINLHAGLASASLEKRPESAKNSLGIVRSAAQSALAEIGGLLTTLRQQDAPGASAPRLDRLDDLLRGARDLGLDVSLRVQGEPVELPYAVDVTAWRVLQEALTNAHKHGSGTVAASVTYLEGHVLLRVENPLKARVAGPAAGVKPSGGRGLMGMRERMNSVKGILEAGVSDNGNWVLLATLPTLGPAATEPTAQTGENA